jgi:plastocyanin
MSNAHFVPATITVPRNSIIKWTNLDAERHHVDSYNQSHPENGWFKSPDISQGQSTCFRFTASGTYGYSCLGEGMVGTVIVQ